MTDLTLDLDGNIYPAKWCICSCCRGKGASSLYLGAFTREDMDEQGPEFMSDYMNGAYDRPCDECDGTGKVVTVDRARCSGEQLQMADEYYDDLAHEAAEQRAEMGIFR